MFCKSILYAIKLFGCFMQAFILDDEYVVGHEEIDAQHQRLFGLVRELRLELYDDTAPELIVQKLKEMQVYAAEHFTSEVKFMEKYKDILPFYEQHLMEHEKFVRKTHEFLRRMEIEGFGIAHEVLVFLENWLKVHVLFMDKKCFDIINEHLKK